MMTGEGHNVMCVCAGEEQGSDTVRLPHSSKTGKWADRMEAEPWVGANALQWGWGGGSTG